MKKKNDKQRLKYGLTGGIIGIIAGIISFIIGLNLTFDEWYFASIGFPFGLGEAIGKYLGFEGLSRVVPYFLGGIIIYTTIGVIISILIYYVNKK